MLNLTSDADDTLLHKCNMIIPHIPIHLDIGALIMFSLYMEAWNEECSPMIVMSHDELCFVCDIYQYLNHHGRGRHWSTCLSWRRLLALIS